ncbi:MAG: DNA polymerase III epsilon subunit-like protein [bacterium]|jgi:DNA polymerase III epsilon subunit-like protein
MKTVYLDLETTGLDEDDEILECSIVGEEGEDLFHSYFKPIHHKSWKPAQRVNHISPKMVEDAPSLRENLNEIIRVIKGKHVVIYNSGFDCRYLPIYEHAKEISCCMVTFANWYADKYYTRSTWRKLTFAASHIKYEWRGSAHSAKSDALACQAVWKFLQSDDKDLPLASAIGLINFGGYVFDCAVLDDDESVINIEGIRELLQKNDSGYTCKKEDKITYQYKSEKYDAVESKILLDIIESIFGENKLLRELAENQIDTLIKNSVKYEW